MSIAVGSAASVSTWGKFRCPLINGYNQWQATTHNLNVDDGFRPDGGYFLRTVGWPSVFFWLDINSDPHNEYDGPIVGYQNGGGVSPYDSFFSVGAYDWSGNDTSNAFYTSVNNGLDEEDIADSLVGLTVTYSGGTFTTTSDAFEQNPPYTPWFGQSIGFNTITSVTSISTFTAF
jgi:hypothetical protein